MQCPCCSNQEYTTCCQIYHDGTLAPTAEKLMRSRYSAYALGKADYIMKTQSNVSTRESIEEFSRVTTFEKLEILEATKNTVTFRATLSQGGKDTSFTEKSSFEKIDGKWIYTEGVFIT